MANVITPLLEALEAALDVFKGPAATQAQAEQPLAERQAAVKGYADKLRGDAAKLGVMLGDGSTPLAPEELLGLLGAVQSSAAALVVCLHSLTHQAGPTLKQLLKSGATSVGTSAIALIKAAAAHAAPSPATPVTHAIGAVWDACDAVKKQPLDNKAALFKHLAATIRAAKDAVREMDELAKENAAAGDLAEGDEEEVEAAVEEEDGGVSGSGRAAAPEEEEQPQPSASAQGAAEQRQQNGGLAHAANGRQATQQDGDEEEEEDEEEGEDGVQEVDFDGDPLSPRERQVLSASQELLRVAVQVVQLLAKHLLTAPALAGEAVEAWESSVWHAATLQRGVEDLGAALYAPQDPEEVSGAAEAVAISLECMLDEVPHHGDAAPEAAAVNAAPSVPQAQVQALQQSLELVKSRLDALLSSAANALVDTGADGGEDDGDS